MNDFASFWVVMQEGIFIAENDLCAFSQAVVWGNGLLGTVHLVHFKCTVNIFHGAHTELLF